MNSQRSLPSGMANVIVATVIVTNTSRVLFPIQTFFETLVEIIVRAEMLRICQICLIVVTGFVASAPQTFAQPQQRAPAKRTAPTQEPTPEPSPSEEQQDVDTLKINTNLVTVPVIATTVDGNYLRDLREGEFSISEDGVKQE